MSYNPFKASHKIGPGFSKFLSALLWVTIPVSLSNIAKFDFFFFNYY